MSLYRFLLFTVGLAFMLQNATAAPDTARVRAGEHIEYSRLVIPYLKSGDNGKNIPVKRTKNLLTITLTGETRNYELSDVNALRKAHRIQSVTARTISSGVEFRISLKCTCPTDLRAGKPGELILDVYDIRHKNKLASFHTENTTNPNAPTLKRPPSLKHAETGNKNVPIKPNNYALSETSRRKNSLSAANLESTRAELTKILSEAKAAGLVRLNNAETVDSNSTGVQEINGTSYSPSISSKTDEEPTIRKCPNDGTLAVLKMLPEDILFENIQELHATLNNSTGNKRAIDVNKLIASYTVLGFFEEAEAVAKREKEDTENFDIDFLEAIVKISNDVTNPPRSNNFSNHIFSQISKCDEISSALHEVVSTLGNEAAKFNHSKLSSIISLSPTISGAIYSRLAFKALNQRDEANAKAFTELAAQAYGINLPEHVKYLKEAVEATFQDAVIPSSMMRHALKPGSLQQQAIGDVLAIAYQNGESVDENILGEIVSLTKEPLQNGMAKRTVSLGATAMADQGELDGAIELLDSGADFSPEKKEYFRSKKDELLISELKSDSISRQSIATSVLLARGADSFSQDRDMTVLSASVGAKLGLPDTVAQLVNEMSNPLTPEETLLIALASFNAGQMNSAQIAAERFPENTGLAHIRLRALNRGTGDNQDKLEAEFERLHSLEISTLNVAEEAFNARNWKAAIRFYENLNEDKYNIQAARKHLLASLAYKQASRPEKAIRVLTQENNPLHSYSSFFDKAPPTDPIQLDPTTSFSNNLKQEIDFIQQEISQ